MVTDKPTLSELYAESPPAQAGPVCAHCGSRFRRKQRAGSSDKCSVACRFWSRVDRSGSEPEHVPGIGTCWNWSGYRGPNGYGKFILEKKLRTAHRVAFYLTHGRWPEPCCCHKCDNRRCVRPEHLFEGTLEDNNADRHTKGRTGYPSGELTVTAKLTAEDVREIREAYARGELQREIGARYGVKQVTISRVVMGKSWRHV